MSDSASETGPKSPGGSTLGRDLVGVSALLISVAFLLTGNGLQGTLVPIRGNIEQFGPFEIGLLGTGYFVGFTLGCVFGPQLMARGGHIKTFMAMASLASVMALVHVIIAEPHVWIGLRAITGFCFAVLYIVIESWLNEKSSNDNRGAVFSIYTVINLTVITAGQMMVALDDPAEFSLFAMASILVSLAGLPLAFAKTESPGPVPKVKIRLIKLYRVSPVGVAGCIAIGLANGAFWTLGPVFAQNNGLDAAGVGVFMSAVVVGGAIVQWPLGALSDRVDRRHVVVGCCVASIGIGIAMTVLPVSDGVAIYLYGGVFGMSALPIYALVVAHTNDHAAPSDMVEVSSGLLLLFGLGAAVGPVLSPLLSELVVFANLFTYTAIIHALFLAFVLWRLTIRKRVGEKDRVTFNESVIAAQTVSPLETSTVISATENGPSGPETGPND
ncbi:MAG: MFS transporter [Alphaproteobacteria bacterium]